MPRAEDSSRATLGEGLLGAEVTSPQQQRLSSGSGDVAAWLLSHGLDMYTSQLFEGGYTRVALLRGMDKAEIESVVSENSMPRPHARAFATAVQELQQAAPPATKPSGHATQVQNTTPVTAINQSMEAGAVVAAPLEAVVVHAVPTATSDAAADVLCLSAGPAQRPHQSQRRTQTGRTEQSTELTTEETVEMLKRSLCCLSIVMVAFVPLTIRASRDGALFDDSCVHANPPCPGHTTSLVMAGWLSSFCVVIISGCAALCSFIVCCDNGHSGSAGAAAKAPST
eukprot:COSAG02_NODE_53_length_44062_cov_22.860223_23_plen_283_part_00